MRNAEATRERILAAAFAEFAAYGIAGARVDRIAQTAGCNKHLIYLYFENKETLLTTVLQRHVTRVYEDLPFTPEDLPGYAARVFDFAMAHPEVIRLMTWFGLEQTSANPPERRAAMEAKVAAVRQAQQVGQVGTVFSPGFVMTALMTLAMAWTPANPFGPSYDPAAEHPAALRVSIVAAITLLAQAHSSPS